MYLLSPFVWIDEAGGWRIAVRAVPRSEQKTDKIARIHLGCSADGVRFVLDDMATLAPGSDADRDGCEDPTVLLQDGVHRSLFYNGANDKTQWRIGWACLDAYDTTIVERGDEPLITPPPVTGDETNIAFCSSAVQTDEATWLLYTVSDKDVFRVRIAFA